ncbi:MAG: dihydroorotase [Lachnospiraceae bacterium]|nr:dihydroorotase [Lachnospiraceae bacterium]
MRLFIENGYMIDPASGREGLYDILICHDRIEKIRPAAIQPTSEACPGAEDEGESVPADIASRHGGEDDEAEVVRLDASGLMVAPGLVDVHAHFRDPGFTYKEDIDSGSRAAARGGYTSVVLMANTKPAVDNAETLGYVLEKGRETGIHVYTCANVTMGMKGQQLVPMEELKGLGAVGFTDDGVPLLEESVVRSAMEEAARLDVPISFHEENPAFIINNGINRGKVAQLLGIGGSDRQAEIDLVARDLELALETGACINIQHISTKEAVELVRRAKQRGDHIHAEATPHHIALTQEAVLQHGTLAKMNPPLREEGDRQAIIRGLADGTIDIIATDHAPHSREEKAKPITEAPSGITGLETALSLGLMHLVNSGEMTMMSYLEKLTCNPARMYHLDAGYLAEGGPADLVIFDAGETWLAGDYVSKSDNTPFTGQTMKGVVKYTICGGRIVYQK